MAMVSCLSDRIRVRDRQHAIAHDHPIVAVDLSILSLLSLLHGREIPFHGFHGGQRAQLTDRQRWAREAVQLVLWDRGEHL